MRLIINCVLGFLAALALFNLIIVKFFDIGCIDVTSSREELANDLAVSYITGYFVYFLTVLLPKYQLDKSNNKILSIELNSIQTFIERRLSHILGLTDKGGKESFTKALANHAYGDMINLEKSKTYQQALQEIYVRVGRLKQYESFVIDYKKSDVYDNYVKVIKFVYHSGDYYNFINKEEEQIVKDKINIGKTIHNLYHNVISLKKSL